MFLFVLIALPLLLTFALIRTPRAGWARVLKRFLMFAFVAPAFFGGPILGYQLRLATLYGFDTLWTHRVYIVSAKPFVRLSNGDTFPDDQSWFLFGSVGFLVCGCLAMALCFSVIRRFAPAFFRDAFPDAIASTRDSKDRNA